MSVAGEMFSDNNLSAALICEIFYRRTFTADNQSNDILGYFEFVNGRYFD